jgi:membrane protease YdiL (CAAX protease family)
MTNPVGPPLGERSRSGTLAARFVNLVEIVVVALGGPVVVHVVAAFLGLSTAEILLRVDYLFILLMSDAAVTLPLIWLLLRRRGESLATLSWRKRRVTSEAFASLIFLPVLFGATFGISILFHLVLPDWISETNPLLEAIRTQRDLVLLLISSLVVGGFKEEIQRAFVLQRFGENLGGYWVGLVLWSAFFGYGHLVQGVDKAIAASLLGFLFGLLYLRRGNLIAPILAHALYDVITLMAFWFTKSQTGPLG